MVKTELIVRSEQGLHARPADLFVRTTNRFNSDIRLRNLTSGSDAVNAKSILRVIALGVYNGHRIEVNASGGDEREAIRAITRLIESNFEAQA